MKAKEILRKVDHRPYELPAFPWRWYQEWRQVIFLHWQVTSQNLRRFVPAKLDIDTFDQKAWISLVAFSMKNIRPKWLPALRPFSNFHEVNFRTYVKNGNKSGVYFLSIEASKSISSKIARLVSGLPYRHSHIVRGEGTYFSRNQKRNESLEIEYIVRSDVVSTIDLDKWLIERYCLMQDIGNTIFEFEIHHPEWPIQEIKITKLRINYPRFNDLVGHPPDRIHHSPGVNVVAWDKVKTNISSLIV